MDIRICRGVGAINPLFRRNSDSLRISIPIHAAVKRFRNSSCRHKRSAVYNLRRNIQIIHYPIITARHFSKLIFSNLHNNGSVSALCSNGLLIFNPKNLCTQCFKNGTKRYQRSTVFNNRRLIKV